MGCMQAYYDCMLASNKLLVGGIGIIHVIAILVSLFISQQAFWQHKQDEPWYSITALTPLPAVEPRGPCYPDTLSNPECIDTSWLAVSGNSLLLAVPFDLLLLTAAYAIKLGQRSKRK